MFGALWQEGAGALYRWLLPNDDFGSTMCYSMFPSAWCTWNAAVISADGFQWKRWFDLQLRKNFHTPRFCLPWLSRLCVCASLVSQRQIFGPRRHTFHNPKQDMLRGNSLNLPISLPSRMKMVEGGQGIEGRMLHMLLSIFDCFIIFLIFVAYFCHVPALSCAKLPSEI